MGMRKGLPRVMGVGIGMGLPNGDQGEGLPVPSSNRAKSSGSSSMGIVPSVPLPIGKLKPLAVGD